jgi:hypothetical protein
MWFKTRVGLVSTKDPTEILVSKNAQINTCQFMRE